MPLCPVCRREDRGFGLEIHKGEPQWFCSFGHVMQYEANLMIDPTEHEVEAAQAGGNALGEALDSYGLGAAFAGITPEQWRNACLAFASAYVETLAELSAKNHMGPSRIKA